MRRLPMTAVVAALLALPLAVLAVRAVVGVDTSPVGDVALIELRVRDVFTAHNPTLGSYGRYGFNHPGPLWFYVLAVPYRLTGQLEIGVLLVGVLSVAAILWVAARRGGLWWAAFLTAVYIGGVGPAYLSNPWEPHGLLLPCAALLLLAYDALAGRAWSLPLVAAVASLLGAAQATLLPFAFAMGVVALWRTRERKPLIAAGVVLLVLWSPTIWQQWTGDPTNITQMRDAPSDTDDDALGSGSAWDAVAIELGHRPTWVGFPVPLETYSPFLDLGAAPLVPIGAVALLVALVRRRTPLVVTAAVAAVAGVVAMSQLLGPVYVWIPQWLRVIGFGCWLAIGWLFVARFPRPVLAAGAVLVTLATTWRAATFEDDVDHLGNGVRRLLSVLPPVEDPILVSSTVSGNQIFGGGFDGLDLLVLELEKRGVETVVDPRLADRFGPRRADKERADDREVILVDADHGFKPPDFRSIGVVDPLPDDLRGERNRLLDELDLPHTADAPDYLRAVARDPSRQGIAEALLRIPNPPRIELMLSPAAG